MSRSITTLVHVSSKIEKLSPEARRSLTETLQSQSNNDDGFARTWKGTACTELQLGNNAPMPIGSIGVVVTDNDGGHYDSLYAVVSYPIRQERVDAIALRTALVDTLRDDDVSIYIDSSTVVDKFIDGVTGGVSDIWTRHDWELADFDSDVLKECGALVTLRESRGKKTFVSYRVGSPDTRKMLELTEHMKKIVDGNVDRVLCDSEPRRRWGLTARLDDVARQMETDLYVSGAQEPPLPPSVRLGPDDINKIMENTITFTGANESSNSKSQIHILCSSCMDLVRVKYHVSTHRSTVNILVTTCCGTCTADKADVIKLKPALIKVLTTYDIINDLSKSEVEILASGQYTKHVDHKAMFNSLTKDHSVAMLNYESKTMTELRGGFF